MSNLKLGVDVVGAHSLLPKDGHGSSSAVVELHFDNQTFRTTVKEKDLNPVWNESFYFNILDPSNLHNLTLDAYIYNDVKSAHSKSFLGKVSLHGTSFVPHSNSVVLHYPLEKLGVFSRVRGRLGLRVYTIDNPSKKSSTPLPAPKDIQLHAQSVQNSMPANSKSEARHTFHHLQNSNHQNQQQNAIAGVVPNQVMKYGVNEMKSEPLPPQIDRMNAGSPTQEVDYFLKETMPFLGGGQVVGGRVVRADRTASTYDLVERMQFLYVRVVKARDLPVMDVTGSVDPYVEARIGNYKQVTKHIENQENPAWNVVFGFLKERLQSFVLEVVVKDNCLVKDDFVGQVKLDLNEVPTRVPPDSPLAPQWYRLEDEKGEKIMGELMLAVWIGTQADEVFMDAWHLEAATCIDGSAAAYTQIRSKVYQAPRLWYVRVNVVEAQDLVPTEKNRVPDVYVKAQIGNQVTKTKNIQSQMFNPRWNEDLLFVVAEPFEDHLVLTVEDRVNRGKEEIFGRVTIPLSTVEMRADDHVIPSCWFNLEKPVAVDVDQLRNDKFSSRLHLRLCVDGGYHVLDESTHYCSDLRPAAKQLWKPPMGVLELGVLNAVGLHPMKTRDGKGTVDTYCVAKYGDKWVRTRTIVDNLFPKYNDQYTWEVFDPATVLTVGIFDNSQLEGSNGKDLIIGKVQIRISTLETGRVYTHSYPLLVLHPTGVKKMGELHLAIRFSCTSLVNMLYKYLHPLWPKMHYVYPFTTMELEKLRHHAVNIVATRLGRAEPPLRKEVVEYMLDVDSHLWSLRRSKANFFRLMNVFSGLFAYGKWFGAICMWKNPIPTVIVHVLFILQVRFPRLILPTVFLFMFLKGVWNFRYRPMYPPHINIMISQAESVSWDTLDEEFDTFPTSKSPDLVMMRYDRLRTIGGRIETFLGDIVTQGERLRSLLSWQDPQATALSVTFCLVVAIVLWVLPFKAVAVLAGLYVMRHPKFRYQLPSAPVNFFQRLPAGTDCMLLSDIEN